MKNNIRTSKACAMLKLCDRITFCIRLSTDLDPCLTRSFSVSSNQRAISQVHQ